jgi:uncharacterized protein
MRSRPGLMIFAVFAATLIATPSLAADNIRVIEVDGHADVRSAPDTAHLSIEIETHAPTAEDASQKNAARAQKVIQVLKGKVAEKGTVTTGNYSLTAEYSEGRPNEPRPPTIVGYNAQNAIEVETSDLVTLGALIDASISAGANRINAVSFELRDSTKARQQAIERASADAQAQAQALALSLHLRLKQIVKASTAPQGPIMPRPMMAERQVMMTAVSTPIEAGELTVSASVSLTYEIE